MNHFLVGPCASKLPGCSDPACPHVTTVGPNLRFYVTMGHAGFNSAANNGKGYKTPQAARAKFRAVNGGAA